MKCSIDKRYEQRSQAEHYRDRFKQGRKRKAHERESAGLVKTLGLVGHLDRALDVGCGPGRFRAILAGCCRRLFLSDYSWNMLDVCRVDHPETRGGLVQVDARRLPFVSGAADLVFCHRLLNHVPNPDERRQMLSELRRVSRQFVLMSCFGPPRILGAIRKFWRRVTGRAGDHMDLSLPQFIAEAAAVGLLLSATTPISARILTGAFLLFRVRST